MHGIVLPAGNRWPNAVDLIHEYCHTYYSSKYTLLVYWVDGVLLMVASGWDGAVRPAVSVHVVYTPCLRNFKSVFK
jgi:hypothetical protein